MMDEELILLNPGPACTSKRVKDALLRGDLCHREPEFTELLFRIREALPRCLNLGGTHEALLVTGSGTAAMEMAVISSVRAGRGVLVVNNGVYGDRMIKIAKAHGIPFDEVRSDWTVPADPEAVRAALAGRDDVDAVVCVHHETTTGLINPIKEIGEVVAESGALFVIDAISGTAIEDQDLAEVKADVICGTANKGLHGLPGMSFILCSEAAIERVQEAPVRSLYLNAAGYLAGQRKGDVPFTPAVQVCYSLDEAIKEYEEAGGFAARTRLYRERAALVRGQFERLGLKILVDEQFRSNTVTMLHLPENVTYAALHDELKKRGYVVYAGQGQLSADFFRICTMGEIPWHRLEQLEDALRESIEAARG
ncbi:pyridoxal-phosphate-dependent aminotransferase family protein [Nonomuraea spiralis]|uniref:pyridoxal-phosphate-dependent aminotransferase family protein n=1 Tax=Nonomuraea TaxID=83681 RepID=UPI000F7AABEB|nr:aminotransferase class V-fold PLP-dependent enzyme [Nonomuraea sp. WAC 01424]RSN09503.1 2-aminoethylphosphonate aminotransferase [Nonomuraea sp. WAC 01424]